MVAMGTPNINSRFIGYRCVAGALLCAAATFHVTAQAQEPAPDAESIVTTQQAPTAPEATPAALLSPEEMEALIRRVEQSDAYSAEMKGQVLPLYDQALELLRQAAANQARAAELQANTDTAQARSEELRKQLSSPPAPRGREPGCAR